MRAHRHTIVWGGEEVREVQEVKEVRTAIEQIQLQQLTCIYIFDANAVDELLIAYAML